MSTQQKLHRSPRNYTLSSVNNIMDIITKNGDKKHTYTIINIMGNNRYQIRVTDSNARLIGHL